MHRAREKERHRRLIRQLVAHAQQHGRCQAGLLLTNVRVQRPLAVVAQGRDQVARRPASSAAASDVMQSGDEAMRAATRPSARASCAKSNSPGFIGGDGRRSWAKICTSSPGSTASRSPSTVSRQRPAAGSQFTASRIAGAPRRRCTARHSESPGAASAAAPATSLVRSRSLPAHMPESEQRRSATSFSSNKSQRNSCHAPPVAAIDATSSDAETIGRPPRQNHHHDTSVAIARNHCPAKPFKPSTGSRKRPATMPAAGASATTTSG